VAEAFIRQRPAVRQPDAGARFYRNGRLCSIGGGADEIMLKIISKTLGLYPRR